MEDVRALAPNCAESESQIITASQAALARRRPLGERGGRSGRVEEDA